MLDLIPELKTRFNIRAVIPMRQGDLESYLESNGIEYVSCRYYSSRMKNCSSQIQNIKAITKNFIKIIISFFYYIVNFRFFMRSDIIYSNTSDSCFGLFASILFRKPHVLHVREFGMRDQNVSHFFGDELYYRLAAKYSRQIIVISKSLKKHIFYYLPTEELKSKINLVYDDVHFKELSNRSLPEVMSLKLLVVGTLSLGKGQEFIIEAINCLSKRNVFVELGIVGDDTTPYALYLKNKVIKLGLTEQVIFHGFCKDMSTLRSQYPIAVVASKSEAFGRVTIEAMGNKQLVVASDTGANPELVKDLYNGYLYNTDDIDSFCRVLENIIVTDTENLNEIIERGFEFSRKFSGNKAGESITKVVSNI